jgi:PhnB protein
MGIKPMKDTPPRVTPYLLYEDLEGAMDWLAKAFGFRERLRHPGPDGKLMHAEMQVGDDGVIMMGQLGPHYLNPKHLGQHTHNVYVRVEELDKHFERAVKAGATVLEKPTNRPYGDRRYGVEDPEGHRWYFAQSISGAS